MGKSDSTEGSGPPFLCGAEVKKSTAVGILSVILLLAALAVSVNAVLVSRSYLDCASRLGSEAPSGSGIPIPRIRSRRSSAATWMKPDPRAAGTGHDRRA